MIEALPFIMFATLFVLLLLGFPVAFTLGGVSVIFGLATFGMIFSTSCRCESGEL